MKFSFSTDVETRDENDLFMDTSAQSHGTPTTRACLSAPKRRKLRAAIGLHSVTATSWSKNRRRVSVAAALPRRDAHPSTATRVSTACWFCSRSGCTRRQRASGHSVHVERLVGAAAHPVGCVRRRSARQQQAHERFVAVLAGHVQRRLPVLLRSRVTVGALCSPRRRLRRDQAASRRLRHSRPCQP